MKFSKDNYPIVNYGIEKPYYLLKGSETSGKTIMETYTRKSSKWSMSLYKLQTISFGEHTISCNKIWYVVIVSLPEFNNFCPYLKYILRNSLNIYRYSLT